MKQTYFDLILIEVLRQGKVCVISNTGGNKWFSRFSERGIFMCDFNDKNKAIEILRNLIEFKRKDKIKELEEKNRQIFVEHFSMNNYIESYCTQLDTLCQK